MKVVSIVVSKKQRNPQVGHPLKYSSGDPIRRLLRKNGILQGKNLPVI